ncbi:hypothetical protein F5884DRAFT_98538 [Xylogone sp. PMI_703]|nr:hypothetical protein F5884DRAFT_98538 [Xylogone sp. PMI_703]
MDDQSRRRRQNEAPAYSTPDQRFNTDQSRGFPAATPERYRPAPIMTSVPSSRTNVAAYTGYYQEPASQYPATMSSSALQYQQGYSPDQRQPQNYSPYTPDLMYNVTQTPTQSTPYDASSQFQTRQPAAMQMLSDVAAPYFPNDPGTAQTAIQQQTPSTSSNVYQQHQQSPAERASLLHQSSYQSSVGMGAMSQTSPDLLEEQEYQPQTTASGMEAAYAGYQTALKGVFHGIVNGRLSEASVSLLEVSEWLLGHVGDLGLTVDEVGLHGDRIRLWGEFNTAWLSIFQKQKDMLESGQRIQPPQSLISTGFITKMAKDLIRLCDAIEKHGLVDYQYGVEEERIINILTETLDLQESIEGTSSSPSGR